MSDPATNEYGLRIELLTRLDAKLARDVDDIADAVANLRWNLNGKPALSLDQEVLKSCLKALISTAANMADDYKVFYDNAAGFEAAPLTGHVVKAWLDGKQGKVGS